MPEAELDAQFANAKAYLMQADKDGVSAYDQLTRLMEALLESNPENVARDPAKLREVMSLIQTHSFEHSTNQRAIPSVGRGAGSVSGQQEAL